MEGLGRSEGAAGGDEVGAVLVEGAGQLEGLLGGAVGAAADLQEGGGGDDLDRKQARGGLLGGRGEGLALGLVGVGEGAQVVDVTSTPALLVVRLDGDGDQDGVEGHAGAAAGVGDRGAAGVEVGGPGVELGCGGP